MMLIGGNKSIGYGLFKVDNIIVKRVVLENDVLEERDVTNDFLERLGGG
jgi:CRISPR/Cas system CSM-associated protein Csm4 (group 5 of RAMP superfamily)